jgi:hypothetical protein
MSKDMIDSLFFLLLATYSVLWYLYRGEIFLDQG